MPVRRLCLPVLLLVLVPLRAGLGAEPDTERLDLRYDMYFGGFHVADVGFERSRDGATYEADLEIRTAGLADLIARYRGRAIATGIDNGALEPRPERYTYRYTSRKSRRDVEVTYDPDRRHAREVISTKRGRADPTDVPRALWQEVIDPLSAILALRERIRAARAGGDRTFEAQVFDGRRRYDLSATMKGSVEKNGQPAIRVDLRIKPLAGFDTDEMSADEIRRGYRARALFSDDERLVPIDIRTIDTKAIVVFRLTRDCSAPDACGSAGLDRPGSRG